MNIRTISLVLCVATVGLATACGSSSRTGSASQRLGRSRAYIGLQAAAAALKAPLAGDASAPPDLFSPTRRGAWRLRGGRRGARQGRWLPFWAWDMQ